MTDCKIRYSTVADPGFSPGGGAPTPKIAIIFHIFAENCMKMKEFGPPGGGRVPGAPPWIRQCSTLLLLSSSIKIFVQDTECYKVTIICLLFFGIVCSHNMSFFAVEHRSLEVLAFCEDGNFTRWTHNVSLPVF